MKMSHQKRLVFFFNHKSECECSDNMKRMQQHVKPITIKYLIDSQSAEENLLTKPQTSRLSCQNQSQPVSSISMMLFMLQKCIYASSLVRSFAGNVSSFLVFELHFLEANRYGAARHLCLVRVHVIKFRFAN